MKTHMPNYNNNQNNGYYPMASHAYSPMTPQQYGSQQVSMSPMPSGYQQNFAGSYGQQYGSQMRTPLMTSGKSNMNWVHGSSGAYSANQEPGTVNMYMDDTEQLFYVKETDPYTGRPKLTAYQYHEVDLQNPGTSGNSSNTVSRDEFNALKTQIEQINSMLQSNQHGSGYSQTANNGYTTNQGNVQSRSDQ